MPQRNYSDTPHCRQTRASSPIPADYGFVKLHILLTVVHRMNFFIQSASETFKLRIAKKSNYLLAPVPIPNILFFFRKQKEKIIKK